MTDTSTDPDPATEHDADTQQLHARLSEAADMIGELQQRLAALATAEEKDRVTAAMLHEAAAQMQAYIAQMQAVTEAALTALPDLQSALQQAETFLAATTLSRIVTDLAETREMIRTALDDRIRSTEQERETAQRELAHIRDRGREAASTPSPQPRNRLNEIPRLLATLHRDGSVPPVATASNRTGD